jgi:glycolate oxidase iron-sulfur subunit
LLGAVLPYPKPFRLAVTAAALASPFQNLYPRFGLSGRRLAAMMRLAQNSFRPGLPFFKRAAPAVA